MQRFRPQESSAYCSDFHCCCDGWTDNGQTYTRVWWGRDNPVMGRYGRSSGRDGIKDTVKRGGGGGLCSAPPAPCVVALAATTRATSDPMNPAAGWVAACGRPHWPSVEATPYCNAAWTNLVCGKHRIGEEALRSRGRSKRPWDGVRMRYFFFSKII